LANYTPLIYSYLVKNYALEEVIGMFQILLPKLRGQRNPDS